MSNYAFDYVQFFRIIKIISFGSRKGAYELKASIPCNNFLDMVRENDFNKLEILLALCDSGKVKFTVGSQSSLPKIALIMGVPSFMIGHEKKGDIWLRTIG